MLLYEKAITIPQTASSPGSELLKIGRESGFRQQDNYGFSPFPFRTKQYS